MLTLEDIKSKHWQIKYLKSVNRAIGEGSEERKKDLTCWSMYHEKMKQEDYDYLTKYGEYDIPVKVRFTSVVKPNINWLVSKYLSNPFNFSVKTVDKKSLNQKYLDKLKMYVDSVTAEIDEKYLTLQTALQQLNDKKQELQMMLQQEPENEEHAKQLQELQNQMPLIMLKMTQMTRAIEREIDHTSDKLDKADLLKRLKPKDIREDFVQRKLMHLYEEKNIQDEHKRSITDKFVTGKPYLYVDLKDNELIYENIPSYRVYHAKNENKKFTEDGDWTAYLTHLSFDEAISEFKDCGLTSEHIKKLEGFNSNADQSQNIEAYEDDEHEGAANYIKGYKPTVSRSNIRVLRVFYQVCVEINIIHSKTKDGKFTHKKVAKKSDLYEKDGSKKKPREGQEIKKRYKTYTLEGAIINRDIFLTKGIRDHQILSNDRTGWNQLPIIGDNFDDISRVPHSIIWSTRELQSLYQIIEYYEELLLVLSGVKGFLMDKSQMPSGMSEKEWGYYRKMGTLYIESFKKDRRQQSNFNQFTTYDDTLPPSIQYLGMMKDRIQQRVDQITGVTRHARGEYQERDPVGTAQLSVQASNIISDVMFWEHDQLVRRALSRALNLYTKYVGDKGDTFSLFDKTIGEFDVYEIPKGLLKGPDFDVFVMNNNKDLRDIEEMRQLVGSEYQRGNLDMSGVIKIFQASSLTEMQILAEQMVDKAQELKQQMAQGEADAEKSVKEFEHQLEMQKVQAEGELKNIENQLNKLELDLKEKEAHMKDATAREKIASDNFLKALDIITKDKQATANRESEERMTTVNQILKEAEIMVQAMLGSQKNIIDDRKISTEMRKDKVS